MQGLLSISRVIDAINTAIGRTVSWLILVAVIISAGNAVIRKVFSTSSNAWLEAQWYLFGAVFMLCAAWTLLANEHIRIDVVNSLFPKRVRNWIDVVGHTLFLMPFCILLLIDSWPFFLKSYSQNEQSMNAGGLVVWPRSSWSSRASSCCCSRASASSSSASPSCAANSRTCRAAATTRWPRRKLPACSKSPRPRACSTRPRSDAYREPHRESPPSPLGRVHRRRPHLPRPLHLHRTGGGCDGCRRLRRLPARQHGPGHVRRPRRLPAARLPRRLRARRQRPVLRHHRHRARPVPAELPPGPAGAQSTAR